jgi:hypothetical protein
LVQITTKMARLEKGSKVLVAASAAILLLSIQSYSTVPFWSLSMSSQFSLTSCAVCSAPSCKDGGALKKCGRCSQVAYCGVDCQRAHWKTHKNECKTATNTDNAAEEVARLKSQLSQFVKFDESAEVDQHAAYSHSHQHGGKPCGGHGPAKHGHQHQHQHQQPHSHSHGAPQHGHSHNGVPCSGHGPAAHQAPSAEQLAAFRQYLEQMQRMAPEQFAQLQQGKFSPCSSPPLSPCFCPCLHVCFGAGCIHQGEGGAFTKVRGLVFRGYVLQTPVRLLIAYRSARQTAMPNPVEMKESGSDRVRG